MRKQKIGFTILQLAQQQEPTVGYSKEDFCELLCADTKQPCSCSWIGLFTEERFVYAHQYIQKEKTIAELAEQFKDNHCDLNGKWDSSLDEQFYNDLLSLCEKNSRSAE